MQGYVKHDGNRKGRGAAHCGKVQQENRTDREGGGGAVIVLRRCASCLAFWEVDADKDKNTLCPKCRSRAGRAKQKEIKKAVRKKRKAAKK